MSNILGRSVKDWEVLTNSANSINSSNFSKKMDLMDMDEAINLLRELYEDKSTSDEYRQMAERILFYIDVGI